MAKLIPHLWYNKEALEAATFYCSCIPNSAVLNRGIIPDTPSGDAELVEFTLAGRTVMAISAGPNFRFNPSNSLMVTFSSKEALIAAWNQLKVGGEEMMPLDSYPFSPLYGWTTDRYGLSWQLGLDPEANYEADLRPCLLFSNKVCGQAEAAAELYTSIFSPSVIELVSYYQPEEKVSPEAKVNYLGLQVLDLPLALMDNGYPADFQFNEAFSLLISCEDQAEIDYYWSKLSAVPEAEECGWLKDRFGVSWQVSAEGMSEIIFTQDRSSLQALVKVLLEMKKLDVKALYEASKRKEE